MQTYANIVSRWDNRRIIEIALREVAGCTMRIIAEPITECILAENNSRPAHIRYRWQEGRVAASGVSLLIVGLGGLVEGRGV